MALAGSGQLSLGDIAGEFGGSVPHALSEYYDEGNAPASGEINISDFHGTSAGPTTHDVEYLVIAGGGGGSGGAGYSGGGAGAGGYRTASGLSCTGELTITVGAGGAVDTVDNDYGFTGDDSVFSSITSDGGGYGSWFGNKAGGNGGSGGGTGAYLNHLGTGPGSATAGQGYDGGNGYNGSSSPAGGGGGAGAIGQDATSSAAGDGGNGLSSSITGSAVTRAGGGGGACAYAQDTGGAGGSGGGGEGSKRVSGPSNGEAGTANTGGGGGGGGNYDDRDGGTGGSGVVILKIADADYTGTTTGSPTVDTSSVADYTILIYNGSGTYTT